MRRISEQLNLGFSTETDPNLPSRRRNATINRLDDKDRPIHDWYRFVLSYPPHLVRSYLREFGAVLGPNPLIFDPFCGTGTTLVEAKKQGFKSVGTEANRFAQFACAVKTDWSTDPDLLVTCSRQIAKRALRRLRAKGVLDEVGATPHESLDSLHTLGEDQLDIILDGSISPLPLHKVLVLRNTIATAPPDVKPHLLLALAKVLVFDVSNLRFGPEVGVGKARPDAAVVKTWLNQVERISTDLKSISSRIATAPASRVHLADARHLDDVLEPNSIDAVITSPPYPNEKDYTRTTRLESVVLGFVADKQDLRSMKSSLIRSNTRNVYKADEDDAWVSNIESVQRVAAEIEGKRIQLGKTSGFEKLYGRVTKLYFGGMARHLDSLRLKMKQGGLLAYVVGDQASYFRVMIRTGELLTEVAKSVGFEPVRIDLFRTRFATATKDQLREEVVILRKI